MRIDSPRPVRYPDEDKMEMFGDVKLIVAARR